MHIFSNGRWSMICNCKVLILLLQSVPFTPLPHSPLPTPVQCALVWSPIHTSQHDGAKTQKVADLRAHSVSRSTCHIVSLWVCRFWHNNAVVQTRHELGLTMLWNDHSLSSGNTCRQIWIPGLNSNVFCFCFTCQYYHFFGLCFLFFVFVLCSVLLCVLYVFSNGSIIQPRLPHPTLIWVCLL